MTNGSALSSQELNVVIMTSAIICMKFLKFDLFLSSVTLK
jgi:hypothetical protein